MKVTTLLFIFTITYGFAQKKPRDIQIDWSTDTSQHEVPLSEFTALMKPDGIPPIDDPKFIDLKEAKEIYFEHEPMIVVEVEGKAKAYPLSILMFHEIVNDTLNGASQVNV
jgi:hypothetical protein